MLMMKLTKTRLGMWRLRQVVGQTGTRDDDIAVKSRWGMTQRMKQRIS